MKLEIYVLKFETTHVFVDKKTWKKKQIKDDVTSGVDAVFEKMITQPQLIVMTKKQLLSD